VDYNRSINAVVIGHVLVLVCLYVSYSELRRGWPDGFTVSFILAILSLASAYVSETSLILLGREPHNGTKVYRIAYQAFRVALFACPATLTLAYVVLFFKLFGV